jgi:hypothetical protein
VDEVSSSAQLQDVGRGIRGIAGRQEAGQMSGSTECCWSVIIAAYTPNHYLSAKLGCTEAVVKKSLELQANYAPVMDL